MPPRELMLLLVVDLSRRPLDTTTMTSRADVTW
jgi:hypothetical protein